MKNFNIVGLVIMSALALGFSGQILGSDSDRLMDAIDNADTSNVDKATAARNEIESIINQNPKLATAGLKKAAEKYQGAMNSTNAAMRTATYKDIMMFLAEKGGDVNKIKNTQAYQIFGDELQESKPKTVKKTRRWLFF